MPGFNYTFDATQYDPQQTSGPHPVGKFQATITDTSCLPTKDNSGGMFVVEFTTDSGKISMRYNLWNQSQKAVEIAHKQLSALCHAVGVFQVQMQNGGAALRGGKCLIEVGKQADGEYVEIKHIYRPDGSEPGKSAVTGTPPQNGGWQQQPSAPVQHQQAPVEQPAQPQQPAWGGPSQQPSAPQQQPSWGGQQANPPAQANGGWQQQQAPNGGSTPPWATR